MSSFGGLALNFGGAAPGHFVHRLIHTSFMPDFPFFDDYPELTLEPEPLWRRTSNQVRRGSRSIRPSVPAVSTNVISVSDAVGTLRDAVSGRIDGRWIAGEVSNLSMPTSGHVYFTIKDRESAIRCAYFAGQARRHPVTFRMGERIEVTGSADVYARTGDLQIKVGDWRRAGAGALYEAYLRLKAALAAEGLFDQRLKKHLPRFVRRVAVVTSPQAAALQDVIRTVRRRMPWVRLMLSPAYVQGEAAPKSLIEGLERAERVAPDVILLVRGGGSFEDLAAFNDEALVRTIRRMKVPVVAGIGHESDETLATLAADVGASTPTAAAEALGHDQRYWDRCLDEQSQRLSIAVTRQFDDAAQSVDRLERQLERQGAALERPYSEWRRAAQRFELTMSRLTDGWRNRLEALERRLNGRADPVAGRMERLAKANRQLDAVASGISTRASSRLTLSARTLDVLTEQRLREAAMTLDMRTRALPDCARRIDDLNRRLNVLGHALSASDPEKPLRQGYAWVERDGTPVLKAGELQAGERLSLRFADGRVWVETLELER